MTKIESEFIPVSASTEKVFDFLMNFNNHETLMPNQVSEWWSTNYEAKLKIQGLGLLNLKMGEFKKDSYIKIIPNGTVPVDLFLEWMVEPADEGSKVKATINADLNMMMRMMAVKPLQGLVDFMAKRVNDAIKV